MNDRSKKPNSTEIARLAGISRSTVSRVINGYPNVPERTRKLVMDTIEKYGYYPSISGQALRGKRMRCLGLFWGTYGTIAYDALASSFLINVIESAADMGYIVLTSLPRDFRNQDNKRAVKEMFHSGRIDAGIFMGAADDEPLIDELLEDGMMVGVLDQTPKANCDNHFTVNMESDVGEMAIRYLVSLGHRDIAVIDGDMHRRSSRERHDSFLRGMAESGLRIRPEWMFSGNASVRMSKEGGYDDMRALLRDCPTLPTAVCCHNDSVAFGVYQALAEHGMVVGKDMSVVGIDGHHLSGLQQPPLTTYRFDFKAMLASLTQRMIRTLEDGEDEPRDEVFHSTFIERASCASIK